MQRKVFINFHLYYLVHPLMLVRHWKHQSASRTQMSNCSNHQLRKEHNNFNKLIQKILKFLHHLPLFQKKELSLNLNHKKLNKVQENRNQIQNQMKFKKTILLKSHHNKSKKNPKIPYLKMKISSNNLKEN